MQVQLNCSDSRIKIIDRWSKVSLNSKGSYIINHVGGIQRNSYDIISLIISTLSAPISDTRSLPGSKKSPFDERWRHVPREKTSFSFVRFFIVSYRSAFYLSRISEDKQEQSRVAQKSVLNCVLINKEFRKKSNF